MGNPPLSQVVKEELEKEPFSSLVLQGGTQEVTELDTTADIEILKNKVRESSEAIYNLAVNTLNENPQLENVVILKRIFRCDSIQNYPKQLPYGHNQNLFQNSFQSRMLVEIARIMKETSLLEINFTRHLVF